MRPQLLTQATAMWTLIRNLGSSIGVSIVIANLTNKTILMHARLAESITPFNQALADPAAAMLDPRTEMGRALLEQIMTQQAAIIAYANDFKLMMIMTIAGVPAHRAHPRARTRPPARPGGCSRLMPADQFPPSVASLCAASGAPSSTARMYHLRASAMLGWTLTARMRASSRGS